MRLIDADAAYKAACEGADNWDGAYSPYRYDRIREEMDKVPTFSPWHRVEEPPKEEGRYWCAKKFAGHWIFTAAWYWNNVSDYTGVPVGEEDKADGFVFGEDVVYPDYWMPIEPPKEDA